MFLQRNENAVIGQHCSNKQRGGENDEKLKLETLVRSVGASIHTTIHVIIVYGL